MKRMVKDSEKIEELADAIKINEDEINIKKANISLDGTTSIVQDLTVIGPVELYDSAVVYGQFTTSNITNTAGEKIVLIKQNMYDLTASSGIELQAINLGTAIFVHGAIDVGKENNEYEIMTVDYNNIPKGLNFVQITGEPVCSITIYTDMNTKTYTVKIHLNKTVSEFPVATKYQFSFIIGALSKKL